MKASKSNGDSVDFATLYDQHEEYTARRVAGSFEQAQVLLEATEFKIPNLLRLLPAGLGKLASVLEIGCATGELIANFPVASNGRRVGCDISPENVRAAVERFPQVEFIDSDFVTLTERFDAVILSDVLEHVEDDAGFLRLASERARYTLINLPLEDNWLNRRRAYGPDDVSGHLRRYTVEEGLDLFRRAGLRVLDHQRIWVHETALDAKRRQLRRQFTGQAFEGGPLVRTLKRTVLGGARTVRPLGRRLFASNLFAIAVSDGAAETA